MSKYQYTRCECFWEYLVPLTRVWGVFTAVVTGGVGVDVAFHHHVMGVYVMIAAVIVFLLEITWAITLFIQVCLRNENSPLLACWEVVLWVDKWRKTIIYTGFSVALFIRPHRLWLSTVAGAMLVTLAFLYLVHSFRPKYHSKEPLLDNREDSYDRFEEADEPAGREESIIEQDVILEM
ncbi:uncharacterized protein LOC134528008 [Bacillus rossius redtenbacheri]|uniref:uncharacterized protein LOC134528008 n=1 Tax=Bacillus rossius redtenbacheri TaxID=93214 RepID=UPI002FDCCBEE